METLSENRKRLHITLSETTVGYLEKWQEMNGVKNRSKAVESLILMSIRDARVLGISALFQEMIQKTMMQEFDKYARVIAHAAIDAGTAKYTMQRVLWIKLLQEFEEYFADLEPNEQPTFKDFNSRFSVHPDSEEGKILIEVYKGKNKRNRERAVEQLKQPLEWRDLLAEWATWDEGSEEE